MYPITRIVQIHFENRDCFYLFEFILPRKNRTRANTKQLDRCHFRMGKNLGFICICLRIATFFVCLFSCKTPIGNGIRSNCNRVDIIKEHSVHTPTQPQPARSEDTLNFVFHWRFMEITFAITGEILTEHWRSNWRFFVVCAAIKINYGEQMRLCACAHLRACVCGGCCWLSPKVLDSNEESTIYSECVRVRFLVGKRTCASADK